MAQNESEKSVLKETGLIIKPVKLDWILLRDSGRISSANGGWNYKGKKKYREVLKLLSNSKWNLYQIHENTKKAAGSRDKDKQGYFARRDLKPKKILALQIRIRKMLLSELYGILMAVKKNHFVLTEPIT